MTWLISAAPEESRGSVFGTGLGAAVAGALLGPALGALAAEVGTEPVFGSVLFVAAGFAILAARLPEAGEREEHGLREVAATMLSRPVVFGTALVTAPSVMFGAVDVLVPLRINALGGGHVLIAVGVIGGAAIEAVLAPLAGRMSDRIGRRGPYVLGMVICAAALVFFALADSLATVIASLLLTALGSGFCFAPAMTLISDAADASGLHQGYAVGVTNMAWAAAQVVGSVAGAAIAGVTGDGAPSIAIAVLMVLTILYAFRALGPEPAPAEG
jgi:MFS family permease